MERVFDYSPNALLEFFKGQCQVFLLAFFHLADRLSAFGNVPANFMRYGLQFLLHLFSFGCANISGIRTNTGFLAMQ